jgi:two-component system sensor histidine kinase RstB
VGPVEGSWSALNETKLALALALALTVAVLFSLPVTLPVARGLDKLRVAARRISEGDLGARADVKRGPARELARAFNAMADHNQRLLESQRHLLEAVSHELRTPTARIRFALEMLDTARDAADRERRLAAIDDDLAEIDDLVAELLTYTRLAGSPRDIEGDTITVADEIEELADYVRERRQRVEVTVVVPDAARDRVLEVEQRLFRRAVRNLMLNAARHAEGRVVVSVEPQPDGVLIAVCDDGPGVPEADRERIFEPFARSDDSRSRDSGGAGLGLAIVRRIMEVHGGTVRCLSCPELGGARFEVSWPT